MKRVLFTARLLVAGVLAFVLASSLAFDRSGSRLLGFTVGAIAFPLVPLGWHAVGELRGRKKTGRKMTGWDRLWLRMSAVAVLAVAATLAIGKRRVWHAVTAHGFWWWQAPPTPADNPLLRHVPPQAECVIWFGGAQAKELMPTLSKDDAAYDTVVAADAHEGMYATRGEPFVAWAAGMLIGERWMTSSIGAPDDDATPIDAPDGAHIVTSHTWASDVVSSGPSQPIRELLARVPYDAAIAAVERPARMATDNTAMPPLGAWVLDQFRLERPDVRTVVAWLRRDGDDVDASMTLEAVDGTAAAQLVEQMRKLGVDVAARSDCEGTVAKKARDVRLLRNGATIQLTITWPLADVQHWARCSFGTPK